MDKFNLKKIYNLNQVLIQLVFWLILFFILPYLNKLLPYKDVYPTQDIFYLKIMIFNISLILIYLSNKYHLSAVNTFVLISLFFLLLFAFTLKFERKVIVWQNIDYSILQKEFFVFFQLFIRYLFFSFVYFNIIKTISLNKVRIQNEKEKNELEMHNLTNQINHHFVYNTIQLLFSKAYKENPELSKKLSDTANVLRENTINGGIKIK